MPAQVMACGSRFHRMAANSWASSEATRKSMRGNRSRDTRAELAVRRLVHAAGLRYRVNERPLPESRRTADLVFTGRRIAVFIDGCYWHGCPEHYTAPKTNAVFWREKMLRNREGTATPTPCLQPQAGGASASGSTRTRWRWPTVCMRWAPGGVTDARPAPKLRQQPDRINPGAWEQVVRRSPPASSTPTTSP